MSSNGRQWCLILSLGWAIVLFDALAAEAGPGPVLPAAPVGSPDLAEQTAALLARLPAPAKHYLSLSEVEASRLRLSAANYEALRREKLSGQWFAALVTAAPGQPLDLRVRFGTWRGLVEFLAEQNAVVEVWASRAPGEPPRRIPAAELAMLKSQRDEPPTSITVTYLDSQTGKPVTDALEFGFNAAANAAASQQAYQRHRTLQWHARQILGAKNAKGLPDAAAQRQALQDARRESGLSVSFPAAAEAVSNDLWVACEFEVDEQDLFVKVAQFWKESEIQKAIRTDEQILLLRRQGEKKAREVWGLRRRGLSDQLEPATNTVPGQDIVELRVKDANQPRMWHVLEFGEPELLKQSALGQFSLLNAHLERSRKARAAKQANLALIAEPIIAGLNIGGGVAGLGFPAGEVVRLWYNLIVGELIRDVPTPKQMRELFALMAARQRQTPTHLNPEQFLSPADIHALKEAGRKLSDREVQAYLEHISEADIRAMLRLARQGLLDTRVTNFLNLLTSAFKVSGVADEAGPIRELFNNVRFAMNGDINLKTLLMLALGRRDLTPLSGVSLQTLSRGQGPQQAWLQYLEVSVDVRAVLNTLVRLTKSTLAKKELEKPFAYSPRLGELAAYEVRVFGFPLFLFYKRGLIKADLEAYQRDYAYGLRGVRIVEHFPTRQAMEAEVRAGRMFPLGFVRVPALKGGWKDTDLVVYAHRITSGKYRGKTSLIIYGLQAYADSVEFIGRELIRFKELEEGLRQGAVIEQRLWEKGAVADSPLAYEPTVRVGTNAVRQFYQPLLGQLLEYRRNRLRQTWGLPVELSESNRVAQALAARGVQLTWGEPLLEVDPYHSSFIYRRCSDDGGHTVKVTHLPALADLERELGKAEENQVIESLRREAAAGHSAGVVLLNEVLEVEGRREIGPLLRNPQGQVVGAGVTSGVKAVNEILDLIERLPVLDRARLRFNHFAATVVELELTPGSRPQPAFLTIEFPKGETRLERMNPLAGESEIRVMAGGLWRQTLTDRRITDLEYDAENLEVASRTWFNRGTRSTPIRGPLLEETRTLEHWFRDFNQPDLAPDQPLLSKLRVNHVTGQLCRETYGLFDLPIETADDQFLTQNRYTAYGLFASATVFENGSEPSDFRRPAAVQVLDPKLGRERYRLRAQVPDLERRRDLAAVDYRSVLERVDTIKGVSWIETIDNRHFGRKVEEEFRDVLNATNSYASRVVYEYEDGFHFGLIPQRARTSALPSGAPLREVVTLDYHAGQRRMRGWAQDYTGQATTNVWDYRWTNPIEIQTAHRRTALEYNRQETTARAVTTAIDTGEVVESSFGQFEAASKTWLVARQIWHRPGVMSHAETNICTASGRRIRTRVGDFLETRPTYDRDGREQANQTFERETATGQFTLLNRLDDDYRWEQGRRQARVRIFAEGRLCDEYHTVSDSEGRLTEDGVRQWPQLEYRNRLAYDGDSGRVLRAEVLQNGQVRVLHRVLGALVAPDGSWRLGVTATPTWGLVATNWYQLGAPLGRLLETDYENGDRSHVIAWFGQTALARIAELTDRHGQPKERWVKRLGVGVARGLPYDSLTGYQLDPWGSAGLAQIKAVVRGTDISLFSQTSDEQVFFDLSGTFDTPQFAADPRGYSGLNVRIGGALQTNVTALFFAQFRDRRDPLQPGRAVERVLGLEQVDLRGFFGHAYSRRAFDRMGSLLEEQSGKFAHLGPQAYSDEAIRAAAVAAPSLQQTTYRYQPGWVRERTDPETGQAMLVFGPSAAGDARKWSVNEAGWREWPTEVETRQLASPDLVATAGGSAYLFRRLSAPRLLRQNRYLPGVTNVWRAWTCAEIDDAGKTLFESEFIFNAQGDLSTAVAHKLNSQGRPAPKIAYQLPQPEPESWRELTPSPGAPRLQAKLAGSEDLTGCDFVGFCLERPPVEEVAVRFSDFEGHTVRVTGANQRLQPGALAFWPIGSGQVQWLPDEVSPERGAVVGASPTMIRGGQVFVVSVPELAGQGLDVRRMAGVEMEVAKAGAGPVRHSPFYRLAHGERPLLPKGPHPNYTLLNHASGLETFQRGFIPDGAGEEITDRRWQAVVRLDGRTVAVLNPSSQAPYYPVLRPTDYSDPDLPQPLCALAAEDGRFQEYYRTVRRGDTEVATVVNGFDTPKLEVFRARILDDELSPSTLAFGQGYYLTVPMAKANEGFAGLLASLHNRCLASVFGLGAERLGGWMAHLARSAPSPGQSHRELGLAPDQRRDIEQLPTLAGAILPRRVVPWQQAGVAPTLPTGAEVSTNALKTFLLQLQRSSRYTNTSLIPTSLNTAVERYVDTVAEGALIQLALKLHDPALAGEMLGFYLDKSQGGTVPLHACYDAETGASMTKLTRYPRPSDAPITAEAQLAIAEAAFCFGTATGDKMALTLGRNLVELLLREFRADAGDPAEPRGLAEHIVKPALRRAGLTFWPEASVFSLKSNARAYLLFARLAELGDQLPFEPSWKQRILQAAQDQRSWLIYWILPQVQATGVVPKGLFEIQEVPRQSRTYAPERWTATADWLAWIEAADHMGVSRDSTRAWLENLARVHGVWVRGIWGLDWGLAIQRPDAIATELTARFLRLAILLEHRPAAEFAQANLAQLRQGGHWPVTATTALPLGWLATGQGRAVYPTLSGASTNFPIRLVGGWPVTLGVQAELAGSAWPTNVSAASRLQLHRNPVRDITQFFWTAAAFYLAIVAAALFWWSASWTRRRRKAAATADTDSGLLVPGAVAQWAEERWAKRVLGLRIAPGVERSRYSNAAIEQNFQMQLRAIYKLALEWRRLVQGWSEDEARLAEADEDEWLNGLDEFAILVGLYTRWVVKAGRKDGLPQADVLQENEDSNHLWSRLVMYFSESHLRLLRLLQEFKADPAAAEILGVNDQIELILRMMGVRPRSSPLDARTAFDVPANARAFDLLCIQKPGATLEQLVAEMERKLSIPAEHTVAFIRSYKSFKAREQVSPIHPYVLEAAKVLPHFLLMGLVALIWYNRDLGGPEPYLYLRELIVRLAQDWRSLIWAGPLLAGLALSVTARSMEVYRYRWATRPSAGSAHRLEADLTSLFDRGTEVAAPAMRLGPQWNPQGYRRAGWLLRAVGLGLLAVALFRLEPPSFATYLCVKGLIGITLLAEAACLLGPLLTSWLWAWLQDRVTAPRLCWRLTRFVNQLNLVPTRPASLVWLSIKYHFQPSVPTGGGRAMLPAIGFYLLASAIFFLVGSYMFKQALEVWFQETYRHHRDWALVLGTVLFWNTMYLLRFGLFIFFTTICSALVLHPVKVAVGLVAVASVSAQLAAPSFNLFLGSHPGVTAGLLLVALLGMAFESEWLNKWRGWFWPRPTAPTASAAQAAAVEQFRRDPNRVLGIVYMSGDALSCAKLTPELLLSRWRLLRDQLDSGGLQLVASLHGGPEDSALLHWFRTLFELEKAHEVSLWHPVQLVIPGEPPTLRADLGLNLPVANATERDQLLAAWHLRRWLVTMMSTAGHAQDTACNLVDLALALTQERLNHNTVFYLIQNKYDNLDQNRPSQLRYDQGELGQRDKLAWLLMELAPGSRAYSINDWTPFGFKAGGLVAMDLVYEESLKLTNMLVLDRNANAHDLNGVMSDLKLALSDPGVVIVIPGRSTTNTLTPIGQSSQLVEEGQRALTRGVMALGGLGGETLGTGWGNIQAVYYGRVQQALCDAHTPKVPLTTPAEPRASFADRWEGLIGFGPHAIGISEDIWGVTQAAHNALALGYRVSFHRSRAWWHKLRETWSHAEWFSAYPRWSGGFVQMMLDPLMQRINDAGPLSIFAKEIRANGGRFFLGAPFALSSILLMPLAIIANVSPFVQILILLWNLGLVMNQVLTALGLIACLESTGFRRLTAIVGAATAGVLAATVKGWAPYGAPLVVGGFLAGGVALGLGRWLYYRGRDVMLFGPQLVIHALGQAVRQSLEFVLSGASANDASSVNIPFRAWVGPREDRPWERYQNLVNLRTVVWGAGLGAFLLNLFALANLDFLNVLLLLPSLMFSVSALVGPYVMHPKPGRHLGWITWAPKSLGWLASLGFYMLIAWLIARSGWRQVLGMVGFLIVFGAVLSVGLRYLGYASRLAKLSQQVTRQLAAGGLAPAQARACAERLSRDLGGDAGKALAILQDTPLAPERQAAVLKLLQEQVWPHLRRPSADSRKGRFLHRRFASEWSRSFVLGLFTLIWFFIVPLPGLLVFTAPGGYRFSISLAVVLLAAAVAVAIALAGLGVSRLLDWWEKYRATGGGLMARIQGHYRCFQSLVRQPGSLTAVQISSLYALFTEVQTYFDQRSWAYVRRTLELIEQTLRAVSLRKETGG